MKKYLYMILTTVVMMLTAFTAGAQKTYVVAVGLTNYQSGENPLPCSRADAQSVCQFFKDYNNSEVFMLVDKNATRDHIMRVLKSQFAKSGPADEVIFVYSGHGFDGGVTCWEKNGAIFCSEIQDIMRKVKARRKVMFIMSCHSGSFSKHQNDPRARNYNSNSSDVLLYLSSRANESSWTNYIMENSYFINALLAGLQGNADNNGDKKVTARELFNFVNEKTIRDSGGKQHPQMYGKCADDMVVVYVK